MKRLALLLVVACTLAVVFFVVLRAQTVAHRMYRSPDDARVPSIAAESASDGYSLAFIEFDDQGFFWDPRQLEAAAAHIRERGRGRGAVVIVFAHGWNHDASEGDNNVACFREVLRAASMVQRANHPGAPADARAVVGVYLGWRGLVFEPAWVNQALTFWNRVTVADRIGARGDMLRTLTTMRELRATVEPRKTRLVVAGHSMGARALFAALGPFYKEHAFRAGPGGRPGNWDVTQSFGDLVALLNPAFSATDYRPIDAAARAAYADSATNMEPNLLIVSSVADGATRDHYPRAQRFSSLFQSFQSKDDRQALATTVGNYEPFITHRLRVASGAVPAATPVETRACPYLQAEDLDVVRGQSRVARVEELFAYERIRHFGGTGTADTANVLYTTALEPVAEGRVRRGPFMVIAADSALIPSHNEIFTPGFIDFLVRVVNRKARQAAH